MGPGPSYILCVYHYLLVVIETNANDALNVEYDKFVMGVEGLDPLGLLFCEHEPFFFFSYQKKKKKHVRLSTGWAELLQAQIAFCAASEGAWSWQEINFSEF